MQHAKLAPSSASRRIVCPGSRNMEAQFPQEESEASREGTAAHWVASELLQGRAHVLNTETPNGEFVTQEMIEGAQSYTAAIRHVMGENKIDKLHIEEKLDISNIHPECWGTPDCWVHLTAGDIHVWDYKFGHKPVEVFENWQLIEYAAGILHHEKYLSWECTYDIRKIIFTIVQPRAYVSEGAIRTWEITVRDFLKYIDVLKVAEDKAMQEDAECRPTSQCNFCSARHACPVLQFSALEVIDISKSNTPHNLTPVQAATELKHLERAAEKLQARITGLQAQVKMSIQSGERVPFYMLEQTVGRLAWTKPVESILKMGEMFKLDLKKPIELITPTQALAKGATKEFVNSFSARSAGAMKLVQDKGVAARKAFGG